jgi:hypothetical protein
MLVAQHIEEVIHGNWTDVFLNEAIADITYEEAIAFPAGTTNSIAMLVNHLEFYNNVVIERIKGNNPVIDEANGFTITIHNDEGWQQLKTSAVNSFKTLAGVVRQAPPEKLFEYTPNGVTTFYKTLHGIAEHAHYHLGQIVLLKKIIRYTNNSVK